MTWIEVIALGVLQGLTEFLPVSSSGHLTLLEHLFGVRGPQTLFDLSLHLGTLAAVLWYFRRVVGDLLAGAAGWALARVCGRPATPRQAEAARLAGLVVVATIPTAMIGGALGPRMEAWSSQPVVTGALLIANGFALLTTLRTAKCPVCSLSGFAVWKALVVGLAQGLAILRGVSRSGSTIVAATHLGMEAREAARFSFLLFLPAVVGGFALEVRHGWPEAGAADAGMAAVGGLVAGAVGVVALGSLMRLLAARRLYWFGPYCIVIGALTLVAGAS